MIWISHTSEIWYANTHIEWCGYRVCNVFVGKKYLLNCSAGTVSWFTLPMLSYHSVCQDRWPVLSPLLGTVTPTHAIMYDAEP